jgi:hypothetical protein
MNIYRWRGSKMNIYRIWFKNSDCQHSGLATVIAESEEGAKELLITQVKSNYSNATVEIKGVELVRLVKQVVQLDMGECC